MIGTSLVRRRFRAAAGLLPGVLGIAIGLRQVEGTTQL